MSKIKSELLRETAILELAKAIKENNILNSLLCLATLKIRDLTQEEPISRELEKNYNISKDQFGKISKQLDDILKKTIIEMPKEFSRKDMLDAVIIKLSSMPFLKEEKKDEKTVHIEEKKIVSNTHDNISEEDSSLLGDDLTNQLNEE